MSRASEATRRASVIMRALETCFRVAEWGLVLDPAVEIASAVAPW